MWNIEIPTEHLTVYLSSNYTSFSLSTFKSIGDVTEN